MLEQEIKFGDEIVWTTGRKQIVYKVRKVAADGSVKLFNNTTRKDTVVSLTTIMFALNNGLAAKLL